MKKIIYSRPDGALCVVHPVINTFPVAEKITEEAALARAMQKLPADAINPQVVDHTVIPTDRTFRDAWVACPGGCRVDMPKAREIHRNRLRALRAPLLAKLDVDYMKALEKSDADAAASIAQKKQALRDVTEDPAIEAAATPEALAAVVPMALRPAQR